MILILSVLGWSSYYLSYQLSLSPVLVPVTSVLRRCQPRGLDLRRGLQHEYGRTRIKLVPTQLCGCFFLVVFANQGLELVGGDKATRRIFLLCPVRRGHCAERPSLRTLKDLKTTPDSPIQNNPGSPTV